MLWSKSLINKTIIWLIIDFSDHFNDITIVSENRRDDHVQQTGTMSLSSLFNKLIWVKNYFKLFYTIYYDKSIILIA